MPKKKPGMTPEEQSERFKVEAERLIADGELNPTEAAAKFEAVVRHTRTESGGFS